MIGATFRLLLVFAICFIAFCLAMISALLFFLGPASTAPSALVFVVGAWVLLWWADRQLKP